MSHLTPPSPGGWRFWRQFQFRAAGFAADLVLPLADDEAARQADALLVLQDEAAELWSSLEDLTRSEVSRLHQRARAAGPGSEVHTNARADLKGWWALEKAIQKRRPPFAVPASAAPLATRLAGAESIAASAAATYRSSYEAGRLRTRSALQGTFQDRRLQEAMVWQNRRALDRVLTPLLNGLATKHPGRDEELLAGYLQRYATKNETIGFFGPVCWARFEEARPDIRLGVAGPLAARDVYFEDWAIEALSARLAATPELLPWMIPTPNPATRLEGDMLRIQGGGFSKLSPGEAALFRASDGVLTVRAAIDRARMDAPDEWDEEAEAIRFLQGLARRRRIHLGLGVRLGDRRPEARLRFWMEKIEEVELRRSALARLDALERGRDAVRAAAGHPERLAAALDALDEAFETQAGVAASRNAGATYGARSIVFEDCRAEAEVSASLALLAELQKPLDLILSAGRWFCYTLASAYETALLRVFEDLRFDRPGDVELSDLWLQTQPLFEDEQPGEIVTAVEALQTRWATALGGGPEQTIYRSEDVAVRAAELFTCPDAGWLMARHVSPDVMIAARDVAALNRGDYVFILGEVHIASNTIATNSIVSQHPDPDTLLDQFAADFGVARPAAIVSVSGGGQPLRTRGVLDPRKDREIVCGYAGFAMDPARAAVIGDLIVVRGARGLEARRRDGSDPILLLDLFADRLSRIANERFALWPRVSTASRIQLDKLVLQRRGWRASCADLAALLAGDDTSQYLSLRRWARKNGLPRWVFVKLAWERKPLYLDLHSPIYVRSLSRQIRNAASRPDDAASQISFSEMAPSHEELWTPFEGGLGCTSELRLVALHTDDIADPGNGC